MFDHKILKQVG